MAVPAGTFDGGRWTDLYDDLPAGANSRGVPLKMVPAASGGPFLGGGSWGCVYLTRHRATGAPVALKVIKPMDLTNAIEKAKMREEVIIHRALSAAPHPNLLRMVSAHEVELPAAGWGAKPLTRYYVGMEVATGGNLLESIRANGALYNEDTARAAFRDICTGVAEMHKHHIVHRDLKPVRADRR